MNISVDKSDSAVLLVSQRVQQSEQIYLQIGKQVTQWENLIHAIKSSNGLEFIKQCLSDIEISSTKLEMKFVDLQTMNISLKRDISLLEQQMNDLSSNLAKEEKSHSISCSTQTSSVKDRNTFLNNFGFPLNDERNAQKIFDILSKNNISYELLKHEPVYTCEQAKKLDCNLKGVNCKNLFLTDKKKKFFFVFTALESTKFKLNGLKNVLPNELIVDCSSTSVKRLQFAKEKYLHSRLGVISGSVTPFGILNDILSVVDDGKRIMLLLDGNLLKCEYAKFHPMVNTMTISLKMKDLLNILENAGCKYYVIDF